jgi:hypothetical protein
MDQRISVVYIFQVAFFRTHSNMRRKVSSLPIFRNLFSEDLRLVIAIAQRHRTTENLILYSAQSVPPAEGVCTTTALCCRSHVNGLSQLIRTRSTTNPWSIRSRYGAHQLENIRKFSIA